MKPEREGGIRCSALLGFTGSASQAPSRRKAQSGMPQKADTANRVRRLPKLRMRAPSLREWMRRLCRWPATRLIVAAIDRLAGELWPYPRWDTALTHRQKLARWIVVRANPQAALQAPTGEDWIRASLLLQKLRRTLGFESSGSPYRDAMKPNDPSSATRPTRRVDCNQSVMAGFAAAHG